LEFSGERSKPFPSLPIIDSPVPPRSQGERYGALFYLGIVGLLILIALLSLFVHGVWTNRDVWADVYILHDRARPVRDRVQAAVRLSQGPRLNDVQLMEMSLRRDLPELARYLLAEAVTTEAVARDPRAYALEVARSQGWPDWLRLLLARRLAYGASYGYAIPTEALDELTRHSDAMIGLWATYSLAVGGRGRTDLRQALETAARGPAPNSELAAMLLAALEAHEPERSRVLDRATLWLRAHHGQAQRIWEGSQPPAQERSSSASRAQFMTALDERL
jgi:hypothetical protein